MVRHGIILGRRGTWQRRRGTRLRTFVPVRIRRPPYRGPLRRPRSGFIGDRRLMPARARRAYHGRVMSYLARRQALLRKRTAFNKYRRVVAYRRFHRRLPLL